MSAYVIMGLVLFGLFILIFLKETYDYRKRLEKLNKEARDAFGKLSNKRIEGDDLNNLKKMFYRYENENSIDDTTASDLDIDDIFFRYNNCLSAPGKEYFYYRLRNPIQSEEELDNLERKIQWFQTHSEETGVFRGLFLGIGNMKKASFFDSLDFFEALNKKNMTMEYLQVLLFFISIASIFISPATGILFFVVVMCINIVTYYKARGEIESSIITLGYMASFLKKAHEMEKIKCEGVSEEIAAIKEYSAKLKNFEKFNSIVIGGGKGAIGTGNPLDLLADYLKMTLHIDIIRFYSILGTIKENIDAFEKIYLLLGQIECYINIASLRTAIGDYCIPEKGEGIDAVNIYHPLVNNPVKNSIKAQGGVLITGSNASGKSTFLKTVAINALFAKTIHTCLADSFVTDDYFVFSSMSLRDDISNSDSYFMVEIKALKRIFDYIEKNPDKKVICFVDEVLRGTNTIERIAACTQILKELNKENVLCFAATHDIELTDILEKEYTNYHFDEEIKENDIIFNYRIKDGKATSKNAIKLLGIMGFSEEIVDKAKNMADTFVKESIWR